MRLSSIVLASACGWLLTAGLALGETGPPATGEEQVVPVADSASSGKAAPEVSGNDPGGPVSPSSARRTARGEKASSSPTIQLGPMGVDENGVQGRIHTVATGDTLWDISDAYLGTPWVWPSVWNENGDIQNPHLIRPGDRIWITANEMRRVTELEAEEMIAASPVSEEVSGPLVDERPASDSQESLPASIGDNLSVPTTGETINLPHPYAGQFAGVNAMKQASRIVDSPTLRAFLTQGDEVYLPLGEGEVSTGDQFSVFRDVETIRNVGTGAVIGYHFDERGWLEVVSVKGEASTAVVKGATTEMQRGDRLVPRIEQPRAIEVRAAVDAVEASIVFTPGDRWMIGSTDSVYLNVGSLHGVEVGTQMEVYDTGVVQDANKMPDTVVARMVVISVDFETCAAFVTHTVRELEVGDQVRGVVADRYAVR